MPTNCEGLTWKEWLDASGCAELTRNSHQVTLRKAWREGEDPTEWRCFAKEELNPPLVDSIPVLDGD